MSEKRTSKNPIDAVIARAMEDKDFRTRLLANPRKTIENDMGLVFPEGCDVNVVENTLSKTTIVLPIFENELNVEQLQRVTGGVTEAWCYHINWLRDPGTLNPGTIKKP